MKEHNYKRLLWRMLRRLFQTIVVELVKDYLEDLSKGNDPLKLQPVFKDIFCQSIKTEVTTTPQADVKEVENVR